MRNLQFPLAILAIAWTTKAQVLIREHWSSSSRAQLGTAIAGMGDVNGDGVDDYVISAPSEAYDSSGLFGRAYVYSGRTGSMIYSVEPYTPHSGLWPAFGRVLASGADLDGDGVQDLVVSRQPGIGGTAPVEVYSGVNGSLIRTRVGKSSSDLFGASFALADDFDGDGLGDVLIGASGADEVHVFSGSDGALLRTFSGTSSSSIGTAVDAYDLTGDGYSDVITNADERIVVFRGGPTGLPATGGLVIEIDLPGSLGLGKDVRG